jgi:hypothetical protein
MLVENCGLLRRNCSTSFASMSSLEFDFASKTLLAGPFIQTALSPPAQDTVNAAARLDPTANPAVRAGPGRRRRRPSRKPGSRPAPRPRRAAQPVPVAYRKITRVDPAAETRAMPQRGPCVVTAGRHRRRIGSVGIAHGQHGELNGWPSTEVFMFRFSIEGGPISTLTHHRLPDAAHRPAQFPTRISRFCVSPHARTSQQRAPLLTVPLRRRRR